MDIPALKRRLMALGLDPGPEDAPFDLRARAAVMKALTDGPDYPLEDSDVAAAAARLRCTPAHIWTSWDIEATGAPFINGKPTILFEPHRFSKATGHRYDATNPSISSLHWNRKLYPAGQDARWAQLLDAVALDVDAGFASASYGGFQILGENFGVCGASSPWEFAWRQSQTVADQLEGFVLFVEGNGLGDELRACKPNDPASCVPFVRAYNGTGYRENRYDERYAAGLARRMGL